MTDTTTTPLTDPRPALAAATDLLGGVIAAVTLDQFDLPTPCDEWRVRELIGHVLGGQRRIAALGRGGNFVGRTLDPLPIADVDLAGEWAAAVADVRAVWADDALLATTVHPPFGDVPGAVALGVYIGEVSVHTWDLARATGQQPAWDTALLEGALASYHRVLPPTRTAEFPFADALPTPADAPVADRLAAYLGRQV